MSDIVEYFESHPVFVSLLVAIVPILAAVIAWIIKKRPPVPPESPSDPVIKELWGQIKVLMGTLQLQNRVVRPSDSMSVRNEGERERVRQLGAEYRNLPEEKRRHQPRLLNDLGVLDVAAGNFEEAEKKFRTVATMPAADPKLQADARYNAYQAALQRQDWTEALVSIRQASALDPARFALFPLDKYEPTRIFGAGGFGVAYLCHHKFMKVNLVVKTLQSEELDGNDVDRVFAEAHALGQLNHPSIIRLSDCGYADPSGPSRPWLAMDYFEGANLESYVAEKVVLSPEELLPIAVHVAEALRAAHAKGILHRDVKPANILVRQEAEGWQVKLIDFGLALRPGTLTGKESTQGPRAQTTIGKSIAGTLHYAAPEQMGQPPGAVVGKYSDVYGFGKTCYYALFETSEPNYREINSLPESWRNFLEGCTDRKIANRLPDFEAVLAALRGLVVVEPPPPGQKLTEPLEGEEPPVSDGGEVDSWVLGEVAKSLKEDGRWEVVGSNANLFVPKAWLGWLPKLGLKGDPWGDPFWIHGCFYSEKGKLVNCMHVARLTDFAKRKEIVTTLLAKVRGLGLKQPRRKEITDRPILRVTGGVRVLEWREDHAPEAKQIRAAVKKTLDDLYPKLEKLALFLKPLCVVPPPGAQPTSPNPPFVASQWYHAKDGKRLGPLTTDQMQDLIRAGSVNASTMVFKSGTSKWTEAGEKFEFEYGPDGKFGEKWWLDKYPEALKCAHWYQDLLSRFYVIEEIKYVSMITIYIGKFVRVAVIARKNDQSLLHVRYKEGDIAQAVNHLTDAGIPVTVEENNILVFTTDLKQLKEKQAAHEWIAQRLCPQFKIAKS